MIFLILLRFSVGSPINVTSSAVLLIVLIAL